MAIAFAAVSLGGLALAIWAHAIALERENPQARFGAIWIGQLALLALFLPIAITLVRERSLGRLTRQPRWSRWTLGVLAAYYSFHFYLFMAVAAKHLESWATWRMFSAGWVLMFALSAIYYGALLRKSIK